MKQREKILAGVVLGFVGLFILGFAVRGFFLKPLKKIDQETALLRERLAKINVERKEFFAAEDILKGVAQRTFGTDINQASARSGEMITRQIAFAGLNESDFTRLPVGPRRIKGASEIGWVVQGKGTFEEAHVHLLCEISPYNHRVVDLASFFHHIGT